MTPLEELDDVTARLAGLHREMADMQRQELEAKADLYFRSSSTSHAGKDREADYGAVDWSVTRIDVRGEIEALRERKDYLTAALWHAKT